MGGPCLGGCEPVLLFVEGGACECVLGLFCFGIGCGCWCPELYDPLGVVLGVRMALGVCCGVSSGMEGEEALARFGGGKAEMVFWRFL